MKHTKSIILASSLLLHWNNLSAQLQVDSIGEVAIGTINPIGDTQLVINGNNRNGYAVEIYGTGLGLKCSRDLMSPGMWGYGMYVSSDHNSTYYSVGLEATANSSSGNNQWGRSYGVIGRAANGVNGYNYAIFGNLMSNQYGAALYGSTASYDEGEGTGGSYATYLVGSAKIKGNVQLVGGSVLTSGLSQDMLLNGDAENLSETGNRTTDKIFRLSPFSFYNKKEDLFLKETLDDKDTIQIRKELTESQKDYLSHVHYGIPLEQLQALYPELVYTNEDGTMAVNYTEMIPLLVQSIKELKTEIDELRGGTPRKQTALMRKSDTTNMADAEPDLIILSQNDPNPFTMETTIAVTLPESVKKADIIIYDMSGKKIKQIEVTGRGTTSINVTSEGLAPGMYLYSLITDGRVVSTKRMILN